MSTLLLTADYVSVIVGFFAIAGIVLVYGIGGAFTPGLQWWTNKYGRGTLALKVMLAYLYYKSFQAALAGYLVPNTQYEVISVLFCLALLYLLYAYVMMVLRAYQLRRLARWEARHAKECDA